MARAATCAPFTTGSKRRAGVEMRVSDDQPQPARGFWHKHGLKLGASIAIGLAFAWALERGGLPLIPPSAGLARVDSLACAEYGLMFAVWHTLRAARWRHLLAPIAQVSLARIVAVSWIGLAAILVLPFRAGEIVRPYLIRQRGRVSMANAAGTIGAERIIDGLCLTVLLGVCMQLARPMSPLPDHIGKLKVPVAAVPASAYIALAMFVAAFAMMALFYFRATLGRSIVEKTLG